jgi:hypothetical protein
MSLERSVMNWGVCVLVFCGSVAVGFIGESDER